MPPNDKNAKLALTLETFPVVQGLVGSREEIAAMIADDKWLPEDLRRVVPPLVMAKLGAVKLKADVVRLAEAAIADIDAELARYGFTFPPPAKG